MIEFTIEVPEGNAGDFASLYSAIVQTIQAKGLACHVESKLS